MTVRKRINDTIGVIVALVLMALAVYLMCVQSRRPTMTVTNAGQKSIHTLVVTVCGEDYAFQDIPVGGQRHLEYEGKGDSGFEVQGQFADGHVIKGNFGYVTTRSFPPVEVVIQEDGSVIGKQGSLPRSLTWGDCGARR